MKKHFFYFGLAVLLTSSALSCRHSQNTPDSRKSAGSVAIKKLIVNGESVKVGESSVFNIQEETSKQIADIEIEAESSAATIRITNDKYVANEESSNKYTLKLNEGLNEIFITITPENTDVKPKTYKVLLRKNESYINDNVSGRLKTLKIENRVQTAFNPMNNEFFYSTIIKEQTISLYAEPFNSSASVTVKSHTGQNVQSQGTYLYNVPLLKDIVNEIKITIDPKNEKLGVREYTVIIYTKEESMTLQSLIIDGTNIASAISAENYKGDYEYKIESKKSVIIEVSPSDKTLLVSLSCNGKSVAGEGGVYSVNCEEGTSIITVTLTSRRNSSIKKEYRFKIKSPVSENKNNLHFKVFKTDNINMLDALVNNNTAILPAVEHDMEILTIEAEPNKSCAIEVSASSGNVQVSGKTYKVSLKEGVNEIQFILKEGQNAAAMYTVNITKYPPIEADPPAPAADEVQINLVVADGVNGSSVDGTYIEVFKTGNSAPIKRLLVRKGKAKFNLKKDAFYDFKMKGRAAPDSMPYYAASDVISYWVDEDTADLSIVQKELMNIQKQPEAPLVKTLHFNNIPVSAGVITEFTGDYINHAVRVAFESAVPIEQLDSRDPYPMLGIGYVPSKMMRVPPEKVLSVLGDSTKRGGKWHRTFCWELNLVRPKVPSDKPFDLVVVAYDISCNRIQYHFRLKPKEFVTLIEDANLKAVDLKLSLERRPVASSIFSVGRNEETGSSTYYMPFLSFKVPSAESLLGFDLLRRCIDEGGDLKTVKRIRYSEPKKAGVMDSPMGGHVVCDTDSRLEEGKTYEYAIKLYGENSKVSSMDNVRKVQFTLSPSIVAVLTKPAHNDKLNLRKANQMDFTFKISNPEILKNASEMVLGMLISKSQGEVIYAGKLKYVFNNGDPRIYFARVTANGDFFDYPLSNFTSEIPDNLINIDIDKGEVAIKSKFLTVPQSYTSGAIPKQKFTRGYTYYWDIVNWGANPYNPYDDTCPYIAEFSSDGTVNKYHYINSDYTGKNACNGRAAFKID